MATDGKYYKGQDLELKLTMSRDMTGAIATAILVKMPNGKTVEYDDATIDDVPTGKLIKHIILTQTGGWKAYVYAMLATGKQYWGTPITWNVLKQGDA